MPGCCVPFCVPQGRRSSFPFPRSHFLSERWRQAIEFGSGTQLVKDFDPLEADICQQHFKDTDGYSEPVIFHNQESGLVVHLSSCRLCLSFDYEEEILASRQMMGNRAIEDILKTTLKIDLNAEDDFLQGICEKCIARLDILVALKRRFVDASKAFRRMEVLIKEENLLRPMEATNGVPKKQTKTANGKQKENTDATVQEKSTSTINTNVLLNYSELTNMAQDAEESKSDDGGNDVEDIHYVEYLVEAIESLDEEKEDLVEEYETNRVGKRKVSRMAENSPPKKRPVRKRKSKRPQSPYGVEDILEDTEASDVKIEFWAEESEESQDDLRKTSGIPENKSHEKRPVRRPRGKRSQLSDVAEDSLTTTPKNSSSKKKPIGRPKGKKSQPPMESQPPNDLAERKCYICLEVFETAKELIFHMAAHVDHDRICKICNEELRNLTTFNRHMSKHDPEVRPFKCDHCDSRYTSKDLKRAHMSRYHNENSPWTGSKFPRRKYPCQHCGKSCRSMAYLIEHEGTHLGIQRHQCTVCGRKFANKPNLDRHAVMHTNERPYKCDQCEATFRHPSLYKDHMRMHSGDTPFACGGCDSKFATPSLLRYHKIRYHGAGSDAVSHSKMRIGTNAKIPKNLCRFCNVSFIRHKLLVDHIERFHPDEQVEYYPCQSCEQKFTEKEALDAHLPIHEKTFACKYCNNRFVSQSGLDKHEPKHNGVKGYLCKTCNNSFASPVGLRRHEATHVGIKQHKCDVCDKEFLIASRLQIHRRIHTGEKPYECHKCGKRFADGSTLHKHLKNVCKG